MIATNRRRFLSLGLGGFLLPLVGCGTPRSVLEERSYVFGTLVDVVAVPTEPAQGAAAMRSVGTGFARMHRDWHAWKPGALATLNAALARGESIATNPSIVDLIRGSTLIHRNSRGLFNPAIGALVGLWGFHDDEMPVGALPAPAQVEALRRQQPTMDDLVLDGVKVASRNRSVQLDFGGYAKGVALDWALDTLEGFGCRDAIVNLGGNLAAMGRRGDRRWRIGIRHPQGEGVVAAVDVEGREAVVTSGSYERYREQEGIRYPHVIDPRTGQPARAVASTTVIHRDAGLADAAATALVVAGPHHWVDVAAAMGITQAMLIDGDGAIQLTPAMHQRLRFAAPEPASITVVSAT